MGLPPITKRVKWLSLLCNDVDHLSDRTQPMPQLIGLSVSWASSGWLTCPHHCTKGTDLFRI